MAPALSHLFLLLFILPLSCAAEINKCPSSSDSKIPKLEAEKLIRGLNLHPKQDFNTVPGHPSSSSSASPRLVEKQLNLHPHGDPGTSVESLGQHAGYYQLTRSQEARLFYFFFESRKTIQTAPVVIWLTGGPGCSSELALFYENGPFHITKDMSLVWNDFGWDQASNLIYVDQPIGTGFSYTSKDDDLRHDEDGVSNDLYDFLQAFFRNHPQYANNDFYITGESYAGHYIPALATRVYQGNQNPKAIHINLKGFAIGNGLTNPLIQYEAYLDYALDMKLINQTHYNMINDTVPECKKAITQCGLKNQSACSSAYATCTSIFNRIVLISDGKNYYDIRKECEGDLCYDFSDMENFLNKGSVKSALGVSTDVEFISCSTRVYQAMMMDWMKNLEVGIPALLENQIQVLIYAGEYDLICNWLGNSRWVHDMEWSGKEKFAAAQFVKFSVDDKEAGRMKSHGPLTFLKVHNAGHMVPMDQPKAALQMLENWMHGKLAVKDKDGQIGPI